MNGRALRPLRHLLVAAAVLALTGPGLGYRHLWQDEVETAERARTILESGYPRVLDRSGEPSLNAGGREIEDGAAHRYTPWLQFYWAAAGLAAARLAGASDDAGVRAPFVVAHAATSALAAYGLEAVAGLGPAGAAAVALALGVQSVRVAHARTARYHALLDLGTALGLLGVGLLGVRRRTGLVLVAASILLLPHVHTLAGAALAACVGALAVLRLVQLSPAGVRGALGAAGASVLAPGLLSLAALLLLTRPWAQAAWGGFAGGRFRSLRDPVYAAYALYPALAAIPLLALARRRGQAALLAGGLATLFLTVRLLDLHPFSQPRYYLAAVLLALLWPLYAGLDGWSPRARAWLAAALVAVALVPDLALGWRGRDPFLPFQGIRLAWADAAAGAPQRQALRRAVDYVRAHAAPGDPVLFEYVPQYASWYLPGHPAALVPDAAARTPLNASNPVWQREPRLPRWLVRYASWPQGFWTCSASSPCDYQVRAAPGTPERWVVSSGRLGVSREMCVVARWPTEHWLNAPFRLLSRAAFRPEGAGDDVLSVAVPCDEAGARPQPAAR